MAKKITPKPFPPVEPAEEKAALTVNGKPIPEEFAHAITYEMTDQGIAERQAKAGDRVARVSVVTDEFSKRIQQHGAQPWDADVTDPMTQIVDTVREPGFDYKVLSPRVMKRRGMRGFEIVPGVQFGDLPIGRMPKEVKARRNKHYQALGNDNLAHAEENYKEATEKLARDAQVSGLAPLQSGEMLTDARDPDRAASVGSHRSRGEQ